MIRKELAIMVGVVVIMLFAFNSNADAGLVSWWEFDEGSGTTAYDTGGTNNNDGTLLPESSPPVGPPTWTSTTAGGASTWALDFDGVDDYVRSVNAPSLNMGTSSFTLESWVKTSSSAEQRIICKGAGSWNNGWNLPQYVLRMYNGRFYARIGLLTAKDGSYTPAGYDDGVWHHVAAVFDRNSDKVIMYVDGIENTQYYQTGIRNINPDNTYALDIGKLSISKKRYFTGAIDEVRIWNEALTGGQILWNKNHPGQIIPEPSALLLLGAGLLGLVVFGRTRWL